MALQSVNPFDNSLIRTYEEHTAEEIGRKISSTQEAWLKWKLTNFPERAAYMQKAATILRSKTTQLARLMALEMGKPVKAGAAEIEKCALCCEYYARHAEEFLQPEFVETESARSYVTFQPLGIVLAIMPWNFPFWQLFRFLAPALMAGNCGILKHASNVSGCALAIDDIIKEAGFPENVFQVVLVRGSAVDQIIENPLIQAVTLTGSTEAGKKVAQKAGSLLKKTVLELGGSDPYIVLKDANLEHAAEICADSRLINSGQSCIAAKRFIVVKEVADEFTALFKNKMAHKSLGDPLLESTAIGPQARIDLREQLHQQVLKSIELGAECILGGEIPEGEHAFYPSTVLRNVKKGMPVYDEETFGPVAAIITAEDEEEAISIANDTAFGLGAAIFSSDVERAEKIAANRLDAGCCFVNESVKSDPRMPFGGIKESGYGRELGIYGIKEFVNIKSIVVA